MTSRRAALKSALLAPFAWAGIVKLAAASPVHKMHAEVKEIAPGWFEKTTRYTVNDPAFNPRDYAGTWKWEKI